RSAPPYVPHGQRQFWKSGAASDSCATRCHVTTSAEPNPLSESQRERPGATSEHGPQLAWLVLCLLLPPTKCYCLLDRLSSGKWAKGGQDGDLLYRRSRSS